MNHATPPYPACAHCGLPIKFRTTLNWPYWLWVHAYTELSICPNQGE